MDTLFAFTLVAIVIALGTLVYVASETKKLFPAALLVAPAYLMLFHRQTPTSLARTSRYPSRVDTTPASVTGTSRIWAFAATPLRAQKVLKGGRQSPPLGPADRIESAFPRRYRVLWRSSRAQLKPAAAFILVFVIQLSG